MTDQTDQSGVFGWTPKEMWMTDLADLGESVTLMERSEGVILPTNLVPYAYRNGDGEVTRILLLDKTAFEDMAQPSEITVGVWPGDKLNG